MLVVFAGALAATLAGCTAPAGPMPAPDAGAVPRMEREFRMIPPIHADFGMGVDDGGSSPVEFVDGRGKSLVVWRDGRLVRWTSPDSLEAANVRRGLWLHEYPESSGSVRILVGSAAESSVADLTRFALAGAITAEHLDLLDRENAWVQATNLRGRIQREDILKRRTSREVSALQLRDFAEGFESRRSQPAVRRPQGTP